MSAARRALYSLVLGVAVEAGLVMLFLKTFSFHNAKQPSGIILNIHAPAMFLIRHGVGDDNALTCSFVVMALFWSAVFFIALALTRKLKRHDSVRH